MGWWFPFLIACTNPKGSLPSQSPIQAQLVVHSDPMVRGETVACESSGLVRCGELQGEPWVRRTNNLVWLASRWSERGRTVDLQMGPDVALAWAEDPVVVEQLVKGIGAEEVTETAARGRAAMDDLLRSGGATLGLHGHTQLQDASGRWGDIDLAEGGDPCQGMREVDAAERVLFEHAQGVAVLAEELDTDILTVSSHIPRSMAGKIAAVEFPDGLDSTSHRDFPERYQPISLSGGLSECFQHIADHSVFEAYGSNADGPLMAGGGPMVVPGHRVVGSMASHLGVAQDGSLLAAERRLFQLMLNWRYAALQGGPERPWVFTFHAHLFDLHDGEPDPDEPSARDRNAVQGQSFRGEVDALAGIVDSFSSVSNWKGVESSGSGVMEWSRVDQIQAEGSAFSYGDEGEPHPAVTDDNNPYLHLVSTHLKNSHKVCEESVGGTTLVGFERCDAGWSWGTPVRGFGCSDGSEPTWVGVALSAEPSCVDIDPVGLRVAPVDGDELTAP
ncbi:MAG: hypothetical protein ACPGTU_02505, partial [Myxococcota bacterium]